MRSPLPVGAGVSLVAAMALWSCGGKGSPAGPANSPQTVTVNIVGSSGNSAYRPNPVAAGVGDTVVFRNDDSTIHHIVLDDGTADLGTVNPGAMSQGFTVRNTNAAKFHCTFHSSMVGSINAATAPEPPPCNDPQGYGC